MCNRHLMWLIMSGRAVKIIFALGPIHHHELYFGTIDIILVVIFM